MSRRQGPDFIFFYVYDLSIIQSTIVNKQTKKVLPVTHKAWCLHM